MTTTSTPLTLEEFLLLPEEEPSLEFFNGVVTQKVSPKTKHSRLQFELLKRLDGTSIGGKLALAFPELRTTFAGASVVPDVAVYREDRIRRDANGEMADDVLEPPDIAIEIVSPGQSANALVRRCAWYVAHGVQIALLVDPSDRSVVAFRPHGIISSWYGADRIDLSDVLPDFDLSVEQLFASLR